MSDRADPLGDLDLSGFAPVPATKPKVKPEAIRLVSEANNFPSRSPAAPPSPKPKHQRRRRTGRSVQFNIKTTPEAIERFVTISDRQGWVFGETLDHALDALEQALARKSPAEIQKTKTETA
jgi:hypothetical protein